MPTLLLNIADKIAINALGAASAMAMDLNNYVEWCLQQQMNETVDHSPLQDVDEIAAQLLNKALGMGSLFGPESLPYQVEEIYKRIPSFPKRWEELDRGFRIMLGKAFRRKVGDQSNVDGAKVVPAGHTQQNQSLYKTVGVAPA